MVQRIIIEASLDPSSRGCCGGKSTLHERLLGPAPKVFIGVDLSAASRAEHDRLIAEIAFCPSMGQGWKEFAPGQVSGGAEDDEYMGVDLVGSHVHLACLMAWPPN